MKIKDLPKNSEHRKRLREKFLQGGLDGFLDYEIIELLLTLGTPRKDCKPMAKEVIKKFGGLQKALEATTEELQQINGLGPHNTFGLKIFQALSVRSAKEKLPKKIVLDSPQAVATFLQEKIGREKREHFYIITLDSRNNLVNIKNISIGTLNTSLVHPREVFKEVIRASATKVIIAHNHPSGDTEPSEADLMITNRLIEAGKILEIAVVDHIIVTDVDFLSFKESKLLWSQK
ncbi:DNA repair protein RadC [Patescibacteria group bacterium]|nr:DNA repair protein RadC [Patescibacteria group bacterium]